jgi:dipeptidyl aminopeptidase/acylaminoacyl peptidase
VNPSIVHGEDDNLVPIGQSVLLHEALTKAGVDSTLVRLPNAGHGGAAFNSPEMRRRIADFFTAHLKPEK